MNELVSHKNDFSQELSLWIQGQEMLADPVTRRDYFQHLSDDDFIDLTQQVASIIRTGDSGLRQRFDGDSVSLMFHEVPDQRDKEPVLRETWVTAKSFLTDQAIPDEDALEYAALTVATGILWAHPFADGNGRTSRTISYIMARGLGDEQDLKTLMTKSSPVEWQVFVSPKMVPEEVKNSPDEQLIKLDWPFSLAGEADDALGGKIADMNYRNTVFNKFLSSGDSRVREIIEPFIKKVDDETSLDADLALKALVHDSERGIEFAQKFLDLRRQELAGYIRRFMDSITDTQPGPFRVVTRKELDSAGLGNFETDRMRVLKREVQRRRTEDGKILPRDEMVIGHRSFSTIHHNDPHSIVGPTPKKRRFSRK